MRELKIKIIKANKGETNEHRRLWTLLERMWAALFDLLASVICEFTVFPFMLVWFRLLFKFCCHSLHVAKFTRFPARHLDSFVSFCPSGFPVSLQLCVLFVLEFIVIQLTLLSTVTYISQGGFQFPFFLFFLHRLFIYLTFLFWISQDTFHLTWDN